jgi:hypothetical protein
VRCVRAYRLCGYYMQLCRGLRSCVLLESDAGVEEVKL